MLQEACVRTWEAGGAELVARVTGDALTYSVNAFGMWNVVAAEAAACRRCAVGTYQLR